MTEEFRNALPAGTVIDTYQIEKILGVGGFGITYLVRELNLGKLYAIKELLPDGIAIRQGGETTVMARSTSDQDNFDATRKYFISEAQVLAGMSHPAVVSVHRLMEANGTCYMVMDYVEGDTLGDHLKKRGGVLSGADEFKQIFYPLMSGLEILHDQGIIHRDIKPGNIMVKPDGSPVLLDFGAATQVQAKTMTITQMLSAGYSPFEQYTSRAKQGPYTDIYALGATMLKCITGEKPDDASDRVYGDRYQPLVENGTYVHQYGTRLLDAVDASLRMDMAERPQTVAEWRTLMEPVAVESPEPIQDEPIVPPQPAPQVPLALPEVESSSQELSEWERSERAPKKSPWLRASLIACGLLGVFALVMLLVLEGGGASHDTSSKKHEQLAHSNPIQDYELGLQYFNGAGVGKDLTRAFELFQKSAEQGNAPAQYHLGFMYANGTGADKDEREAVKWFSRSAAQGNAQAQNYLGLMYTYGNGVNKDEREAVKWYRLAADQGHAAAQNNLGVMYTYGRGVDKDEREAVKWYRKAAEQGYALAQYYLGWMYASGTVVEKDDRAAMKWYRKAAEQGHEMAQNDLVMMYANGTGRISIGDSKLVGWIKKTADEGNVLVQLKLGVMYEINQDEREAVKWYRKAAEKGNVLSQYNLGRMYAHGRGVSKDEWEALKWYRKAAAQGDTDAQNALKKMGK